MGLAKNSQSPSLSVLILKSMGQNGLLAGGVCTLLGVAQALGNLDDIRLLGAAMALSLLGLFYALSFHFVVLLPLQNGLQRKIEMEFEV